MHLGGHLPPGRPGVGVQGALAGGVVVPHRAPQVHRHGVGPAGGRLPLEEAAAWVEAPVVGGVPTLYPAMVGRPPHWRTGLLPPH